MKLTQGSPAYVVFKESQSKPVELIYFQSSYSTDTQEDGTPSEFSPHKGGALIFQTLAAAARVAKGTAAAIRILISDTDAEEFSR